MSFAASRSSFLRLVFGSVWVYWYPSVIATTSGANTGLPCSIPSRGACLRARMNAVTITTIATINTNNEAMRPIAGIFSLIIKRLPTSIAGAGGLYHFLLIRPVATWLRRPGRRRLATGSRFAGYRVVVGVGVYETWP